MCKLPVILDLDVENKQGEFDGCSTFADQVPIREEKIFSMLSDTGIDLNEIDAVSGRGVGVYWMSCAMKQE